LTIEYALKGCFHRKLPRITPIAPDGIMSSGMIPRYGTGLIPASVPQLIEIVLFWHSYYNFMNSLGHKQSHQKPRETNAG
jgi:hypothetical protein